MVKQEKIRKTTEIMFIGTKNDGLIEFNGISTCLGLFYAQRLGNHIPVYIFYVVS